MKFFAAFAIFGLLCGCVFSQTIHFLCVTDQSARNIGSHVDREKMKAWITEMSNVAGIPLREVYIDVSTQDYRVLEKQLRGLAPDPADVVFFYYSGHGSEACSAQAPPPSFRMRPNYCFSQQAIHRRLLGKNPRLLITLFDCCVLRGPFDFHFMRQSSSIAPAHADSVRKLFLNFRGDLSIKTNDPAVNPYSYGDPFQGGLFTFTFIDQVGLAVRGLSSPASWDALTLEASEKVTQVASEQFKVQKPLYFSTLRPVQPLLIRK